jgi:hypothetical protein
MYGLIEYGKTESYLANGDSNILGTLGDAEHQLLGDVVNREDRGAVAVENPTGLRDDIIGCLVRIKSGDRSGRIQQLLHAVDLPAQLRDLLWQTLLSCLQSLALDYTMLINKCRSFRVATTQPFCDIIGLEVRGGLISEFLAQQVSAELDGVSRAIQNCFRSEPFNQALPVHSGQIVSGLFGVHLVQILCKTDCARTASLSRSKTRSNRHD